MCVAVVNDHDGLATNPFVVVAVFVPSVARNVSDTTPSDAQIVIAQLRFPSTVEVHPEAPEKMTFPEFVAEIVIAAETPNPVPVSVFARPPVSVPLVTLRPSDALAVNVDVVEFVFVASLAVNDSATPPGAAQIFSWQEEMSPFWLVEQAVTFEKMTWFPWTAWNVTAWEATNPNPDAVSVAGSTDSPLGVNDHVGEMKKLSTLLVRDAELSNT